MKEIDAYFVFAYDYNYRVQKGDSAIVDAIKKTTDSQSGISVRVVNRWKAPHWFDIGWFEGFK